MKNANNAKIYCYLALATFLVLAFCIGSYYYLAYTSNQTTANFNKIETAIMAKDWQSTNQQFNESFQYWQGHKTTWQTLIDHREIDDIECSFLALAGYIKGQSLIDAIRELYILNYNLQHVPQTKALTLGNFF